MFSPQDDEELRNLVDTFGESNWNDVAIRMPFGFNSRQCRERWRNYVNPSLHNHSWTDEDDRNLIDEFAKHGTRWTVIAEAFPGRSGNTVRNRYFLLQRRKDKQRKEPEQTPQPPFSLFSISTESGLADSAKGISWFTPGNFDDIGQDSFMSIEFPPS
jgi:hypothetical protein